MKLETIKAIITVICVDKQDPVNLVLPYTSLLWKSICWHVVALFCCHEKAVNTMVCHSFLMLDKHHSS